MIKRFALAVMLLLGGLILPLTANSASAQTGGSLAGTTWVLSEIAGQQGTPAAALGNPTPSLNFSNDGRIGGSGGCNSYGGAYTQSGSQLNISEVVSTLRACVDDSLNKQEKVMLGVLNGQVNFKLADNKLTLTSSAGTLTFVSAPSSSGPSGNPGAPATGNGGSGNPVSNLPIILFALALSAGLTATLYTYSRRTGRSEKR